MKFIWSPLLTSGVIKDSANLWHTLGSVLIGAAITTLIAVFINDFKTDKSLWICWTAFVVTGMAGALSFYFGYANRQIQNKTKEDVIEFMEIIEERFQNTLQPSKIIINSAKYGGNGQFADATSKITGFVNNNILEIKADNSLVDGNDPIVGTVKTLIIDYTINGEQKKLSILEGTTKTIE